MSSKKHVSTIDHQLESNASHATDEDLDVSRRGFLKGLSGTGALAATGLGMGAVAADASATPFDRRRRNRRRVEAFWVRKSAARAYLFDPRTNQEANDDEALYADLRGSFFKTLPQNNLGEVDPAAYQSMLDAFDSGDPQDFDNIPLSPQADRKLANPQAAFAFEMTGGDGHTSRIPPAPAFASALQSAEMGEVYWHALIRDVPFREYDTNADAAAAAADLNAFSQTVGPTQGGVVTPGTLFRGETPGDLIGPYISQFLWMTIPYGRTSIEQRYMTPLPTDLMLDYNEWLAVQRGAAPSVGLSFDATPRYIYNGRGLGEFVHVDFPFQAYLDAALILLGLGGDALDPANPYKNSANQGGFVTHGAPDILDQCTKACNVSLKTAWYQKWLVHRRLRPEVMAARIENQLNGTKDYGINGEILGSDAVGRLFTANGNRLLPMAFPEGSPTHPSYPAGHATIAGACTTVLKAFFDESYVIPSPVEASVDGLVLDPWNGADLTIGNELNKLANNMALGRDIAGVHYRTDGVDGILAGEQVALGVLRDYSRTYNEEFGGFELTRFDGTTIRIVNGRIHEV